MSIHSHAQGPRSGLSQTAKGRGDLKIVSTSTIPQPSGFFGAILRVVAQSPDGVLRGDIYELVADSLQLTPAQRAERLPKGAQSFRYRHRIGWSLNMLKVAGYVEAPSRGVWRLTPRGQEL